MPNIALPSLYTILIEYGTLKTFLSELPGVIQTDLSNPNSELSQYLENIFFSLGERITGAYNLNEITQPDTIRKLLAEPSLATIKNDFIACFLLFYLYQKNSGNEECTLAIETILNNKMKTLFSSMQSIANKNDVIALLSLELVSINKTTRTETHVYNTVHGAPPHSYTVTYTECKNTYLSFCHFPSWIHTNIHVFNEFKRLADSLEPIKSTEDTKENDNDPKSIPYYQTPQLTFDFYRECLWNFSRINNSLNADDINRIYIDLLSLMNSADIIYYKDDTITFSIARRHKALLYYPAYYTKEGLQSLYNDISLILLQLTIDKQNKFFEFMLDPSNALIKFLSSSKEGMVYLNKFITDYAILENRPIKSKQLDIIQEEDEESEKDDAKAIRETQLIREAQEEAQRQVDIRLAQDSTINWKAKGAKEELTRYILQLPLREQAKYILEAFCGRYNEQSRIYEIYHTQRGRFKPSTSHLGSQLDQLVTQLSIIQDELYHEIIHNTDLLQKIKDIREVFDTDSPLYAIYHHDGDWSQLKKFSKQLAEVEQEITAFVAKETTLTWLTELTNKEFGLRATFSQVRNSVSSIRDSLRQSLFSPPNIRSTENTVTKPSFDTSPT